MAAGRRVEALRVMDGKVGLAAPGESSGPPPGSCDGVLTWRWNKLGDIAPLDLLGLLALRSEVFVVEQRCLFVDIDAADRDAWHLHARSGDRIVATLRLLAPGVRYAEASIGRVCVAGEWRGAGLGRALMIRGLDGAARLLPGKPVRISAQQRLESFYQSLAFETVSQPYDEDGIGHVEMLRPARLP